MRCDLVERWTLAGLGLKDETNKVLGGIGNEHLVRKRVRVRFDALVSDMQVTAMRKNWNVACSWEALTLSSRRSFRKAACQQAWCTR